MSGGEENQFSEVHFAVRDTGPGIAKDKQAAIFQPFVQADGSATRRHGGTGLGLTISTQLTELMGGRIWLESEIDKGSTFHLALPLPKSQQPAPRAVGTPPDLHHLSVLIVDDNATNRKILVDILKLWGCRPTAVDGARAAIAALLEKQQTSQPFHLVLTDAQMPDHDGFMFIEAMRQFPELTQVAIMMLTSVGQYADVDRCRSIGISAYLTKPVRQHELQEAILRVLTESRSSHESRPRVTRQTESEPRLSVLLVEDNAVNQKVAQTLLEKWQYRVTTAANGVEALSELKKTAVDIVLMDLQMPVMDGFQTTNVIRSEELRTGRRLPIIGLSAHAMRGDRERCLNAGMDEYVSKPIRAEELKRVLESVHIASARTVSDSMDSNSGNLGPQSTGLLTSNLQLR
jgi:CheY-like chemotaxis protein